MDVVEGEGMCAVRPSGADNTPILANGKWHRVRYEELALKYAKVWLGFVQFRRAGKWRDGVVLLVGSASHNPVFPFRFIVVRCTRP